MTTDATSPAPEPERTLYVVATVHLDTQWRWTIQDTIRDFIPATLERNFALFERHPFFVLSFEGAFRYQLMKEYYPDEFERLRSWVKKGRWRVAGNMLDSPDVNAISPESLLRHILYGRRWFATELGTESSDLFLPDCFGFGQALPSVAAHCGLRGFSSQKFGNWGAPAELPFDVGRWEGPDGASILAAVRPEGYGEGLAEDLSHAERWKGRIDAQAETSGAAVALMYVGVGDRGGSLDEESVEWLAKSVRGDGPVTVLLDGSDRIFTDLEGVKGRTASLPTHRGELLLPTHGTGCWTSQAPMKRWNRLCEQLADAAERAAVAADWLGARPYPAGRLREAWTRFLWHQQHDDLTGTSIPDAYRFSWNDQLLALNQFADVLTSSVDGVAASLDTRGPAIMGGAEPLVVYNPLSIDREDLVAARLDYPGEIPAAVRVFDALGDEVPSQITDRNTSGLDVVFLARVPSVGFRVFHVRETDSPCVMETGLEASPGVLENRRYRVEVDRYGDLSRVHDKLEHIDLLSAPAGLELLPDRSSRWPAWEIHHRDLVSQGDGARVAGPARVEVVEKGPARVVIEVRRSALGSRFAQRYVLAAGDAGDRLEVEHRIDWNTRGRLLKAVFPLGVSHPTATYDLGLGAIERGNNTPAKYEVPAQQWADLTSPEQGYGVSILNNCKYGWDKPDDGTLRLSLLRSPRVIRKFRHQGVQDLGPHRFTLAVHGHTGSWQESSTAWQAARLNQPMLAFHTASHPGGLGTELSFLELDEDDVAVRALKRSESGDGWVVRLQELAGRGPREVSVALAAPLRAARRLTGAEEDLGEAIVEKGRLRSEIGPFAPQTFSLTLDPSAPGPVAPRYRTLDLDFDLETTSRHGRPRTGDFDGRGHTLPAELFPGALESAGVPFELGPAIPGTTNALVCGGQRMELPEGPWRRLHLLASATAEDVEATFEVGGRATRIGIQSYTGIVGCYKGWRRRGRLAARLHRSGFAWGRPEDGFIRRDPIAWFATHRHDPAGLDEPYVYCYLFRYTLDLPEGARELGLPDDPRVLVFAATLAGPGAGETRPATTLYD